MWSKCGVLKFSTDGTYSFHLILSGQWSLLSHVLLVKKIFSQAVSQSFGRSVCQLSSVVFCYIGAHGFCMTPLFLYTLFFAMWECRGYNFCDWRMCIKWNVTSASRRWQWHSAYCCIDLRVCNFCRSGLTNFSSYWPLQAHISSLLGALRVVRSDEDVFKGWYFCFEIHVYVVWLSDGKC